MKKLIAMIVTAALLWSLTGCSNGDLVLDKEPENAYTSKDGIYISVEDMVTKDGVTVLNVLWHNETRYEVTYGAAYTIQRKEKDEWVHSEITDVGFIDIAYILEPNSTQLRSYTVSQFFDVSREGTYRIVVDCYLPVGDNESQSVQAWAAFTLTEEKNEDEIGMTVPDTVQYIRTDRSGDGLEFPDVKVIRSREELESYYRENKDDFDLERREKVYSDTTIGFLDACDRYDDAFFADNTLVMILLEEPSGSIRHRVTKQFVSPLSRQYLIYIDKEEPEVGTCDMAYWHILVAVKGTDTVECPTDVEVIIDNEIVYPDDEIKYDKPVIYLYPQVETAVSVKLLLDGKLTCTYPAYDSGWNVTAQPDGTLTDEKGQIYQYLYWEGETSTEPDMSSGFCVKGEDTAAFLEWALEKLGLNRREANEFIVYWLPLMQENPYNIISFQGETYTRSAQLDISPMPDTVIRVFMAWKPSETEVELPEQELSAPERTGFTVVEWGGTRVP